MVRKITSKGEIGLSLEKYTVITEEISFDQSMFMSDVLMGFGC